MLVQRPVRAKVIAEDFMDQHKNIISLGSRQHFPINKYFLSHHLVPDNPGQLSISCTSTSCLDAQKGLSGYPEYGDPDAIHSKSSVLSRFELLRTVSGYVSISIFKKHI